MFETPILLIIFNRPDTTRRAFEVIRQQKPKYLFVAADGPRFDHPDDVEKCTAARNEIKVDWDCRLELLYREENFGCGKGPASAITWFFNNVDKGIIIEDDCILSKDAFEFYEKLLERYKFHKEISVITASNLLLEWRKRKNSYFFAGPGAPTMGCWASWNRAWAHFDYQLFAFENTDLMRIIDKNFLFKRQSNYWKIIFNKCKNNPPSDIWDYQWHFARAAYSPITIVASVNLVSNIGFDDQATHTKNPMNISYLPIFTIDILRFNPRIKRDYLFDWLVFERYYNPIKISKTKKVIMKAIKMIYT